MPAWWQELLELVRAHVWVQVVLVVVATAVASWLLGWVYRRVFRRLASRTTSALDDALFRVLHPAIRTSVVLAGTYFAVELVADEVVTGLVGNVAKSIGILVWTSAVIRALSLVIRAISESGRVRWIQPRTRPLFDTIQKVFIAGACAYVIFLVWNIDLTAWIASAGIVGIAVGFAAKDTLANLFAGFFILVDAPYRIGDMILLDTGERGRVVEVGIRSTRIVTREDVEIIIPNSAIGAAKITNESGGPYRKRRVDVRVGVSYGSDLEVVRRVLHEAAEEVDLVCPEPEPRVRFREMGDSSLVFSLLFWIGDPEERGAAIDAVNTFIFSRFGEVGVEIPFPQRVVHLQQAPDMG